MSKVISICIFFFLSNSSLAKVNLDKIKVPEGFSVNLFYENIKEPRQMAISPSGVVYVSTRETGSVYALRDVNHDGKADEKYTLATNLNMPNGVAFKDGNLYVAEVHQILVFKNIEAQLDKQQKPEEFFKGLPSDKWHGWKYITFNDQGDLLIPIGAPCNICLKDDPRYSALHSLNLKTKTLTKIASGIRNTVGITLHPQTNKVWFTDNGRDSMGDDIPPCELNMLTEEKEHFGFPFVHGKNIADPEFGKLKPKNFKSTAPQWEFGAHVAALGLKFYQGDILVALHGSWNRTKKSGYKVVRLKLKDNKVVKEEDFLSGFLQNEKVSGRPVDLLELPDGSILVSDDFADAIYRISPKKK